MFLRKRVYVMSIIAALGAAIVIAAISNAGNAPATDKASSESRSVSGGAVERSRRRDAATPSSAAPSDALAAQQERALEAYFSRLHFGEDIAAFVEGADRMRADEAADEADALIARIRALEDTAELTASQSHYLQAAIRSAQHEYDSAAREAALADLETRYAGRRAAPSTAHLDDRFRDYKQRESEIVSEILELESYPRGLTREEYLRERLEEARREIYAGQ